ncbi:glycosyltransferase family 2 protein [Xanthomarina sp. F2636L]|uniref:glycosyltransferase family 2 protein n=1 Tax=Xanthomarina sp. F2636L TaxID=2996018 RepID=UPI00225E1AEC|nr:glycosyltransferase family 2 protein [Xanthomarina sp. F2636L]MCX7549976.1 glycosyltransferase family 2 protein [Xanthomarina sp. F2636L]
MSQALVSIIAPCYNVEKFIDNALQSIFLQTYTNWECILVDDGSKDNTSGEIDIWVKKDSRFKYIHQENQGVSGARNTGLKNATGEYILFFDPDDLLDITAIDELIKLTSENIDIVIGKSGITVGQNRTITDFLDKYENPLKKIPNKNKELIKLIVEQPIICVAWNKLFKKSFLDNNQLIFKENILHEDELWVFETFYHAKAIIFNNKPTYYYNWSNMDSITNNFKFKNLEDYLLIIKHIFEKYYKNNSNMYDKEMASIYITHLQMKTIQHGYKKTDKKLKQKASEIIKLNFAQVEPTRSQKVLDIKFEEIQYKFKIVKVLSPKNIAKAIRYFESTKKLKIFKGKLLLLSANRLNKKKNRIINKVY